MKPSQNDKSGARSDLGERALAFLAQHRLSASPINYWVAHDYIRGNDPSLCEALNSVIGSSSAIDDFVVREIYEQHVAGEALRRFSRAWERVSKSCSAVSSEMYSARVEIRPVLPGLSDRKTWVGLMKFATRAVYARSLKT